MEFNILILLACISVVKSAMEGFIFGGKKTTINKYPHSIYLSVKCKRTFLCGGSVLNQHIILTAAHCLEECKKSADRKIILKWGHEQLKYMKTTQVKAFVMHERYDSRMMHNDIALVAVLNPLALSNTVKRVVITFKAQHLPKSGWLAGWGIVNSKYEATDVLLDVTQQFQPTKVCGLMGIMPKGTFCAGPIKGTGTPDVGDSGSALMANDYIQIGIVSYKIKNYSLVVYTNVTFHYKWISRNAVTLRCSRG